MSKGWERRDQCLALENDLKHTRAVNFIGAILAPPIGAVLGSEVGGSFISEPLTNETLHANYPTLGAAIILGSAFAAGFALNRAMRYDILVEQAEENTRLATGHMLRGL